MLNISYSILCYVIYIFHLHRSRERVVRRMFYRLANEFRTVKMEFVTDHMLTIAAFDQVIDSSGIFMLIAPYKMTMLHWPLVIISIISYVSGNVLKYKIDLGKNNL